MKKLYGTKSKIFLIIFLSSLLFLNLAKSQGYLCSSEAISTGWLESPKFCFNSKVNITKFIWKGTLEGNPPLGVILEGFETTTSAIPKETINFCVNPYVIYTSEEGYLLRDIKCLKYKVELYKNIEDSIPRIDQIFIYYSF